ncbi:MAG: hypothetical protein QXH51_06100 [Candidatus Bathyarchaeia archaeon]
MGKLQADPDAYILPKNEKVKRIFEKFASNLLISNRIRFDTAYVTSVYVTQPVLSNIFYTVKLTTGDTERLKALCVWLNSTWGIMTILVCRQDFDMEVLKVLKPDIDGARDGLIELYSDFSGALRKWIG